MLQNLRKRNEGFTIIEVLIVLAIAGLILLVVFLAVPALQRNSRNTQVRNAANSVLSTVTEFVNNNNGQMPSSVDIDNGTVTVSGGSGTASATGKTQGGYDASWGITDPGSTPALGNFAVVGGFKCNGNDVGPATPRAILVFFKVETGGGTADQCLDS